MFATQNEGVSEGVRVHARARDTCDRANGVPKNGLLTAFSELDTTITEGDALLGIMRFIAPIAMK
jgi:hypothetical protein